MSAGSRNSVRDLGTDCLLPEEVPCGCVSYAAEITIEPAGEEKALPERSRGREEQQVIGDTWQHLFHHPT